jgi:Argonaute siRNA chaperone (ARC) complex subunit Arb1
LHNFLNYVEFHNVFPEYADNITAAKALIQTAKKELILNRSSFRRVSDNRRCGNLMPGMFNKACSTYFGGYYQGLYSGTSDEEAEDRLTNRKAMTFLRRIREQKFLTERKVAEYSSPCNVIDLTSDSMILKQCIPLGSEDDYVEPSLKDVEIKIRLEEDVMELIYTYVSFLLSENRGMQIEASWHQLTDGTWYMDQVTVFHTYHWN